MGALPAILCVSCRTFYSGLPKFYVGALNAMKTTRKTSFQTLSEVVAY